MALFSFFKTPRHQKFKYVPRYYDPQKERLDEIIKNARGEGTSSTEQMKSRISRNFQNRSASASQRSSINRRSNLLLVAIIIALFAFTYLLLTVYLPRFLQQIEG